MKTLIAIILCFAFSAHAGGNFFGNFGNIMQGADAAKQSERKDQSVSIEWQPATNVGREPTGDPMLNRCTYRTAGGYTFSITSRGMCPFRVEVNPETSQVRL